MRARTDIFDNAGRKRMVPVPAEDADPKRQKMANLSAEPVLNIGPLDPAVTHSLGDVFTLTRDAAIKSVHVPDLVAATLAARISIRTITGLDASLLDKAISVSSLEMLQCILDHVANGVIGCSGTTCDAP